MLRILSYVILVLLLGIGFAWLAERLRFAVDHLAGPADRNEPDGRRRHPRVDCGRS